MFVKIIRFLSPSIFEGDKEKTRTARFLNIAALSSMLGAVFIAFVLPSFRRFYVFPAITILLGVL